jgi:hypothetical protein
MPFGLLDCIIGLSVRATQALRLDMNIPRFCSAITRSATNNDMLTRCMGGSFEFGETARRGL